MEIKVYESCLVDSANGIYTAQVFAERYPELITDKTDLEVLLSGPDNERYLEVYSKLFPIETESQLIEQNETGDVLSYKLIDSEKIALSELETISFNPLQDYGKANIYECKYGYCYFLQAGENCLFRAHYSNVGLIGADCFFEFYDFDYLDRQLEAFFEELQDQLREEFEEDHDIFILPEFYACYLINSDPSGLTDRELEIIDEWVEENTSDLCCGCSEESFFTLNHELSELGAGSCLEFYFPTKKVESVDE